MKRQIWMLVGLLLLPLLQNCGERKTGTTTGNFQSPWTCEEHWMVASTVRDLQGMTTICGAAIGSDPAAATATDHEFQVGTLALKMAPSCWDTASFDPLLAGWQPAPQTADPSAPDLLHDLLTPTAAALQKANRTVSARIQATPAAAVVHEEAAFLLGVLGIRENAQQFADVRPLLCRMTAHLVLAGKLRGTGAQSPAGDWARVLYDYHAGRPIIARRSMESISRKGDAERWRRAIEILITGDWRPTVDLPDITLLEAIATARALDHHRGSTELMKLIGRHEALQATPEWSRLISMTGRSVDDGHLAMRSAIPMEFSEIHEIFPIGKTPTPASVASGLGRESPAALLDAEGTPRVISDGDWAAYFRRHFFMVCGNVSRFAERKWGSHEAAEEWQDAVMPFCSKLPNHELLEPLIATNEDSFNKAIAAASEFILQHPEQAPMGVWFDYRFPNLITHTVPVMPDQIPWFRQASPPGTAHHPIWRICYAGIQNDRWVGEMKALHQIDPWDVEICFELAENTGNNPDAVKAAWGDLMDYSVRPLSQVLKGPALSLGQRIETLQKLAPLDPQKYLQLGMALVIADRPAEAAAAYEKAFKDAEDRVEVSNCTQWLIYHYKSSGQDKLAREVADHNAGVYSYKGLVSALSLAIVEKDRARSEQLAAAVAERYGDSSCIPLASWDDGNNPAVLRKVFPGGLKEVTLADLLSIKRARGARISENSLTVRLVGLKAGDVILAIDGKRTESFEQYLMLMGTSLDPHVRLIYKRGNTVKELDCNLPDRRLDASISDYQTRS